MDAIFCLHFPLENIEWKKFSQPSILMNSGKIPNTYTHQFAVRDGRNFIAKLVSWLKHNQLRQSWYHLIP
jgi:hypothetical protein